VQGIGLIWAWSMFRAVGIEEDMRELATQGAALPYILTLITCAAFAVFGLYGLSGAADLRRLPLLRAGLGVDQLDLRVPRDALWGHRRGSRRRRRADRLRRDRVADRHGLRLRRCRALPPQTSNANPRGAVNDISVLLAAYGLAISRRARLASAHAPTRNAAGTVAT